MKTLLPLFALLCFAHSASASALGDLAASMKAGEWKELATNNISTLLDNGAAGTVIIYTDELSWYPDSQQIYAVVSDHYGSGQQFICYDAKTNAWRRNPRASWFSSGTMHGYDHQAIDIPRGYFYHQPACCGPKTKRYTIATGTWSDVGDALDKYESYMGFEYFPEIGGLVRANNYDGGARGTLKFLADGGSTWVTLASGLTMGAIQIFSEYNPVHKVVVFGGGEGNQNIYKIDASRTVAALANAPVGLGIQEAVFTVDPVSGDYLVFAGRDNARFYTYKVQTDAWQLVSSAVLPIYHSDPGWAVLGIAATPIPEYGVNFFVSCTYTGCKAYLYKHSAGSTRTEGNGSIKAQTFHMEVSPNPVRTEARITLSVPGQVSMYDVSGALVERMNDITGERAWTPDASLPEGVYVLKAQAGQRVISKKIVVQR